MSVYTYKNKGFTLIELLVVIAIITLLSGVIFASLKTSKEKARMANAQDFASMLDRTYGSEIIGSLSLEEGTGTTLKDNMGGVNNGIMPNGGSYSDDTPFNSGYSVKLNGLGNYLSIPATSVNNYKYTGGNMTISLWVKPDASEVEAHLISKAWNGSGQYNYRLILLADKTISLYLQGATAYQLYTKQPIALDRWTHVAATMNDKKEVAVYVDGKRVGYGVHGISDWTPTNGDITSALTLGSIFSYTPGWAGNATFSLNGLIDEPRVYNASIIEKN